MTVLYPIVLETEGEGDVRATCLGCLSMPPAHTHAKAERAIRAVLALLGAERTAAKARASRANRRLTSRI
jgi:hypothetical protein